MKGSTFLGRPDGRRLVWLCKDPLLVLCQTFQGLKRKREGTRDKGRNKVKKMCHEASCSKMQRKSFPTSFISEMKPLNKRAVWNTRAFNLSHLLHNNCKFSLGSWERASFLCLCLISPSIFHSRLSSPHSAAPGLVSARPVGAASS